MPITGVSVRRPTLDDVFMNYTGSTIRDAEESEAAQPDDDERGCADDRRPTIAAVRLPTGGLAHDVRAVKIVLRREMLRFVNDHTRLVSSLAQPILFLFVLGTGLGSVVQNAIPGVDYRTFIYPGVLAMTVITTAMFSARGRSCGTASSGSCGRCWSRRSAGARS